MINAKKLNIFKGAFFEYMACFILVIEGYKILKLNYNKKYTSQIDILVQKHDEIILVEVKYRRDFSKNEYSISYHQKKRLEKSALKIQSVYGYKVRVDAVFFGASIPFYKHVKSIV